MKMQLSVILILIAGSTFNPLQADDSAAVAELKKAGLNVNVRREGGSDVSARKAADLTDEVWKNLETIEMRRFFLGDASTFTDEQMARLCKNKSLEYIFLNGPQVTEKGLELLGQLPKLREFGVHHLFGKNVFRGSGFTVLKDNKAFESLEFGGAQIDDKGLEAIGQLTSLKKLGLYHTEITSASVPQLANLVNLEKLALEPAFVPRYTGHDLVNVTGLKNLQELTLKKIVLAYDDGLSHLAGMKQLKKLTFTQCGISDADLDHIKRDLPDTKIEFTPAKPEEIEMWNKGLEQRKKKP